MPIYVENCWCVKKMLTKAILVKFFEKWFLWLAFSKIKKRQVGNITPSNLDRSRQEKTE